MSFMSILTDANKILSVVGTAFSTVETAVGEGIAPVEAISGVALSLAQAYPPTAGYASVAVDITTEVEAIITALRGIKAKTASARQLGNQVARQLGSQLMTEQYNNLILQYAKANDLDQHLIHYQIQQESNGQADLVQDGSGAIGLMQLMPSSFQGYSTQQLKDPETNIKLGTAYLKQCISAFKLEQGDEKIKFGLAAYNAGLGNIIKAQALTAQARYPTDKWSTVSVALGQITGLANSLQTAWYVWVIFSNYELTLK